MWYHRAMHFKVPHKTSKLQALVKVKQALNDAKPMMKDQATIDEERWEGDTLHFAATLQGKQITGTLEVTDTDFVIDAKLPLLWRMFEGKIEQMIAEQTKGLLQ